MSTGEDSNIKVTGNPFVDTGLAVIAALADLDDIENLSLDVMQRIYGKGIQLASWNSRLKSFSQVFGTNNPLFQKGYGYQKGKGPSELNHAIYRDTLGAFVVAASNMTENFRCEACGSLTDFDFARTCISVVESHGKKAPEDKWVGRDWFPLAGSLGSDAQALPAASRPVHLCAKCLFAVHYLPLGLILLDGRLAVFQSTSVELWYELVRDIVNEVQSRIKGGNFDTLGTKEGTRTVTRRLLGLFERLQARNRIEDMPSGTTLQVWRFTNSGASPECEIEEIPNPALVFLWKAVRSGLRQEVETIISNEGKKERPFYRCIAERRDYNGLYPRGKRPGASPELFALYQTDVCGRLPTVLESARVIARQAAEGLKPNDLKRLEREEAFLEPSVRSRFRSLMINLAQKGEFTHDNYIGLFPLREDDSGIGVHFDGWNLLRYYLHHLKDSASRTETAIINLSSPMKLKTLHYYAARMFGDYVDERGRERFQSEVLSRMGRGEISTSWLKRQFVRLAETSLGFTYGAWADLCLNATGHVFVSELLFQMRLLWTDWMRRTVSPGFAVPESRNDSAIPSAVTILLHESFSQSVAHRGLERFYQDVLLRLRRHEIGLNWFKAHLVENGQESFSNAMLSEEEWEQFLTDEEGRPCGAERLFQMHLVLANMYREAK